MKNILLALVLALSFNTQASEKNTEFNSTCASAYKTATQDMLKLIRDFQNESIDAKQLSALTSKVSTEVSVVRTTCALLESPEARKCSDRYKEVYTDIRAKVSPGALLTGNQTEVEAGVIYLLAIEGRLAYIDLSCK